MWFDTREVSDNNEFARYFQRILYRDFGQYQQLLRIEPGVANYDWLVQTYSERMASRDTDSTDTTEESTSGTTGNTRTDRTTQSVTMTDARTLTTITDESTAEDTTRTDNLTATNSGSDSTTHGHTVTTNDNSTNQASGSDSTSGTHSTKNRSLGKTAPQSISYASGFDTDDTMDWQYPSSQAETGESGSSSDTTTYGRRDTQNRTTTTTNAGTDTYNRGTVLKNTGTQTTDRDIEHDSTVTATHGGTQTTATTHGGTLTDEGTTTSEGESTKTHSGSDITKERYTGRNVDIATLLDNATAFIVKSSAFEWIRERLEPAFMGIY